MSNLGGDGDISRVSDDELAPRGKPMALKTGWYRGQIKDSKYVDNNARTGKVLHLTMRVDDKSNYLRDFLNLRNPNETAQVIGRAMLKKIAIAVNHEDPDNVADSAMLHNSDLMIFVSRVESSDKKFGDSEGYENRVIDYRAVDGPRVERFVEAPAVKPSAPASDMPF